MARRHRRIAVFAALAFNGRTAAIDQTRFCIRYFGSVDGTVSLPQGIIPPRNYNDTAACPVAWSFPSIEGATLELCPPSTILYGQQSDHIAIDATLSFRGQISEVITRPIDTLLVRSLLITNGSVAGPFSADGQPAVLAKDTTQPTQSTPSWTITGNEAAEIDTQDHLAGVYLSCQNLRPEQQVQYCGVFEDSQYGGCWSEYHFRFNMSNPLNYTFTFSTNGATVDLTSLNDYNNTGQEIKATIHFEGTPTLPVASDLTFWNNSEQSYDSYVEEKNAFTLVPDEKGLPLFLNKTKSGEWYDTSNQTYSGPSARSDADGRVSIEGSALMLALGLSLSWIHLQN
jgi:hypothetical protein